MESKNINHVLDTKQNNHTLQDNLKQDDPSVGDESDLDDREDPTKNKLNVV